MRARTFRALAGESELADWIAALADEDLVTAEQLRVAGPVRHLYAYLMESGFLESLRPRAH